MVLADVLRHLYTSFQTFEVESSLISKDPYLEWAQERQSTLKLREQGKIIFHTPLRDTFWKQPKDCDSELRVMKRRDKMSYTENIYSDYKCVK